MTLRHLTIFRAVCQTESITLAAEHLNMAQPAVSLAVRELEEFYGVQLFERMNRRIYITEAGRTLLQYADTILSQYAESVQVLQEARHRGSCRFGVHVTFGETVLPSLLRRLAEQLPDITVRAFVTNTRENEEMLLRNELDFAVIDNVKGLEALRTVPLGKEEMAVVCRPDHRSGNSITLEELAGERLLLREIYYIEVQGHKLTYHTEKGQVAGSGTLQDTENRLRGRGFLRCNKCYLVNQQHIQQVHGSDLVLTNGETLQISRLRKKEFLEELARSMGNEFVL